MFSEPQGFPWKTWLVVTLVHAGLVLAVAAAQRQPGYTDAAYYAVLGRNLAQGRGLTEPFLWTYLDDPAPPPRPGHAYWMPLASWLAALGERWTPLGDAYRRVQAPFVLLALGVPLATGALAHSLWRNPGVTQWAMALSALPGFYLPYLPAVDAFAVLMGLGVGLGLLLPRAAVRVPAALLLGVGVGAVHLARNEGPLWLLVALGWIAWQAPRERRTRLLAAVLAGYLAVMGPWWARNFLVFGSPWPVPVSRLLWLTHYNDFFLYPPQRLTFERWWLAGPQAWLAERWQALNTNVQTLLAVQAGIAGFPLLVWGWWRQRRHPVVVAFTALWLLLLALMTLVLPGVGQRGGYFHAVAGLQPLVWALLAHGFEALFAWGERRRGWHPLQARVALGGGWLLVLAALTLVVTRERLRTWNQPGEAYRRLAARVAVWVPGPCPVLVNDPPSWAWAVPAWPALVVPSGGLEAVAQVARRYGACALLLEPNHPPELTPWYDRPRSQGLFVYLETWEGVHLFRVEARPAARGPALSSGACTSGSLGKTEAR